jgi:hypothetical protein
MILSIDAADPFGRSLASDPPGRSHASTGYAADLPLPTSADPLGRSLALILSCLRALIAAVVIAGSAWPIGARSMRPFLDMRASIVLSGETLRFDLGADSPLPRTQAMPRAHDSRLESKLEIDLRRMAFPWRIEREVAVVRAAPGNDGRRKLLFPDFALSSDGGRVLVEVVGYWTKDYLEDKRAMLNAARVPLVMCVDERHADPALATDPRVVMFKKRIDVHTLLEACGRALSQCGERPREGHGA